MLWSHHRIKRKYIDVHQILKNKDLVRNCKRLLLRYTYNNQFTCSYFHILESNFCVMNPDRIFFINIYGIHVDLQKKNLENEYKHCCNLNENSLILGESLYCSLKIGNGMYSLPIQ